MALISRTSEKSPFPEGALLHEMFRKQARETPDRLAVTDGTRSLTYVELDDLTDRLALWLQACGSGPDKVCAIYMNKQIEYVISYIAILKSNAAYLPMDVAYPPDLVQMVLDDAQPVAILMSEDYSSHVSKFQGIATFIFDANWKERLPPAGADGGPQRPVGMTWENLAYVVYSSGTTGKPKGICCPHRGSVLCYGWRGVACPYSEDEIEREACNVFICWELLRPLLFGQELWIIPDRIIYDIERLPQYVKQHQITRMLFTPSLLEAMLNAPGIEENFASFKCLVLCGEVVTVSLRNKIRAKVPSARIHNLYSISECHDCSASDLTNDASLDLKRSFCPVGKLLPFVDAVILNEDMEEVPVGVPGEIWIAGPTLAREYLRRPELTAERFPEFKGKRVYKTGDIGYLVRGGELEICGRCDSMVKVRGYSIELRAVQMACMEYSEVVSDCLVIADGDAADTEKTLVAYVVLAKAVDTSNVMHVRKQVRTYLKQRLPFYMVPTYLVFLKNFPSHPSGKIDKGGLPTLAMIKEIQSKEIINAPSTDAELKVAKVVAKVLNLKVEGIDTADGFFELGGNSLLTIPLLKNLSAEFNRDVTLEHLFASPSICQLAALLDSDSAPITLAKPPLDLTLEVERHSQGTVDISMQTRAFWRHVEVERLFKTSRVLLTGATGFLGSFLLAELLKSTRSYVYCLVRAGEAGAGGLSPAKACRARLLGVLEQYGQLTEELAGILDQRLAVLVGDAGMEHFGLDEDDYRFLTQHIDLCLHAAAQVNLVYPYDALTPANVKGTRNVISFCNTGKVKALHHVSSDAVFPQHPGREFREVQDMSGEWPELQSGYAQSKWVAEQLVSKAQAHGLPGCIYRCGNIAGHSQTAAWNGKDSNLQIMRACLAARAVPVDEKAALAFEMTPVDFVAAFVVSCVEDIRASTHKTFHLIQGSRLPVEEFLRAVQRAGYKDVRKVGVDEWVKLVEAEAAAGAITAVSKATLLELCNVQNKYDTANVAEWLSVDRQVAAAGKEGVRLPSQYPEVGEGLMREYVSKLVREWKVLPPAEEPRSQQALERRLVVVTGAGAGLGAAVARELVRSGALVLLLDPWSEELEALGKELGGGEVRSAVAVSAHVGDLASLRKAVAQGESHFGTPVWGLVNCAGVLREQKAVEGEVEGWFEQVDVNCKGAMAAVAAVLPSMTRQKEGAAPGSAGAQGKEGVSRGQIVHVSAKGASGGEAAAGGLGVFNATKHFAEAWAHGLRHELAPLGVKVTMVQPGSLRQEQSAFKRDDKADGKVAERAMDVGDIAEAVVFAMVQKPRVSVNDVLVDTAK